MYPSPRSRPDRGWLLEEFPYVRVGDGPRTLLVVPGIGDAMFDGEYSRPVAWAFRTFLADFLEEYTIYMVSRPRGLAPETSIRELARGYARVLDAIGPASVVGISMGGLIAQDLALECPDRIDRLAVVVAGTRLAAGSQPRIRRHRELALEGDLAAIGTDLVRETFTGWRRAVAPWLSRAALAVRPPYPADERDLVVSIDAVLEFDSRDRLDGIEVPTLVAGGTTDTFFPEPILRETHAVIPDARLALFHGTRHGPFLERKRAFDRLMGRFLEGELEA